MSGKLQCSWETLQPHTDVTPHPQLRSAHPPCPSVRCFGCPWSKSDVKSFFLSHVKSFHGRFYRSSKWNNNCSNFISFHQNSETVANHESDFVLRFQIPPNKSPQNLTKQWCLNSCLSYISFGEPGSLTSKEPGNIDPWEQRTLT